MMRPNEGWWILREGEASGWLVGGNLCTLNLLQGTPYIPSLDGAIVLAEDDAASNVQTFARDLTSLFQLPDAEGVRGLVVHDGGRCSPWEMRTELRSPTSRWARPPMGRVAKGLVCPKSTFASTGASARWCCRETICSR
jgi:LD-carboxypeptidase C-terminal domain